MRVEQLLPTGRFSTGGCLTAISPSVVPDSVLEGEVGPSYELEMDKANANLSDSQEF